mmetsp:Transcript_18574/g.44652  ORF Transcript_18574/g.44652 Transcript_18574/m.44652 type:complete len:263 (-) Transcript_18574:203-991(-)
MEMLRQRLIPVPLHHHLECFFADRVCLRLDGGARRKRHLHLLRKRLWVDAQDFEAAEDRAVVSTPIFGLDGDARHHWCLLPPWAGDVLGWDDVAFLHAPSLHEKEGVQARGEALHHLVALEVGWKRPVVALALEERVTEVRVQHDGAFLHGVHEPLLLDVLAQHRPALLRRVVRLAVVWEESAIHRVVRSEPLLDLNRRRRLGRGSGFLLQRLLAARGLLERQRRELLQKRVVPLHFCQLSLALGRGDADDAFRAEEPKERC